MGKLNTVMKNYLGDDSHFADLFNGVCFQGRQKIKAGELSEASEQYVSLTGTTETVTGKQARERCRDLKKKLDNGGALRILAIENQNLVDYTMPLRCMEYDTMEYRKQLDAIKRAHSVEDKKKLQSPAERFSGVTKKDRLLPVYTLCLYHGEEPWDGPRTLKDMMNFGEKDAAMEELFADYPLHIYCINEETDFSVFRTELRELFMALANRRDKNNLRKILSEDVNYRHLHADTVEALSVLLNAPKIWEERNRYMQGEREEEEYDMCQALREWIEEEREEEREEGVKAFVEVCKELGESKDLTASKLIQKYGLTKENAYEKVEKNWD